MMVTSSFLRRVIRTDATDSMKSPAIVTCKEDIIYVTIKTLRHFYKNSIYR